MAARSSLTILFENPFWIGLYERIDGDKYEKSVLEILQMNEYVNYLAEIIPEKDSLQLVKSEADNIINHIHLMTVLTWGLNSISRIIFKYKKWVFFF